MAEPTVSIVINTDNRAQSLANTLLALRYLDYPLIEVCVVYGPTNDGTRELLRSWHPSMKLAHCPVRNLSTSRNLGIALAAGEIVAFIDDDAVPEPEWIRDLVDAYADKAVGAAGGIVHDNTGVGFQTRFATANRFGRADHSHDRARPELCFPLTANFPHLLGTNSSFRRDALLQIGGFDEEYDYFLDETDVCCRLVDQGWRVVQVDGAYVHHKFLPSEIRNHHRVVTRWYPIIKNKVYFSLKNSSGHFGLHEAIGDAYQLIQDFARDADRALRSGQISSVDYDRFGEEVDRAWKDGLERGLYAERKLIASSTLHRMAAPFVPFQTMNPTNRRYTFCLLSQDYPPQTLGGIGRFVYQLAEAISKLGHHVHVLTRGASHDRVDFEDGVWVHRIVPKQVPKPAGLGERCVPQRIWDYAAAMLAEAANIGERRRVDCVSAPIWDVEGIAILLDGRFPLVTSVQTMLLHWLENQSRQRLGASFMSDFAEPMVELEKLLLTSSAGVIASSRAILASVEHSYELALPDQNLALIPYGLDDWTVLSYTSAPALPTGSIRMLFVGRLETRKGIDVLLNAATRLLRHYPHVYLDIVGNDSIPSSAGVTYRAEFEQLEDIGEIVDRVTFHGEVSDDALRGFYRACDIFVAPSRFESFGLIFVEAMMFGKPVVGCRAGGISEVVEENVTGLLAEPGDAESLEACLATLIENGNLRRDLGQNGRQKYLTCFTAERMADEYVRFMCNVADSELRPVSSLTSRPSNAAAARS